MNNQRAVADEEASKETVITATLQHGRQYLFFWEGRYIEFQRSVPKEVSEDVAKHIETLTKKVTTSDGEDLERDLFEIDWEAPKRVAQPKKPRLRMRIVQQEVPEVDRTTQAAKRPGPKGLPPRLRR